MGWRGAGRVFLLALVLLLALQTPAAADKKATALPFLSPFRLLDRHALRSIYACSINFRIMYEFSVIRGLALQIDEGVLTLLQRLPGVLRVIPGSLLRLRTTRSWEFLGLVENGRETPAWSSAKLDADTIIGNIDTGVWPESQSFQDDGLGVPTGWRGVCDRGSDPTFRCNK
ncbi:subtilisin-like protease SBT5.3 [Panicum miliaceum]|uniref:Subtilisin-like protease SBT5.3 n=1 Tax=Panicum miliaceum TaxID=4540 RepID=A0A3L6SNG3_PANMI|nr:subtilisin-like protease SBT5.3 [Panicum miliaceum]